MTRTKARLASLFVPVGMYVIVCLLLLSCSEEFPSYVEPKNVLSGLVTFSAPDTIEVVYDALFGAYYFNTPMAFRAEIANEHDDVLQGAALVNGMITIQSFSEIPRVFLVPLSTGNLNQPPVFQGSLAIPPGRKAIFSSAWLPYDVDGEIVFSGLPYVQDGAAKLFGPIQFIATARVQLFERVPAIEFGDLRFQLVYRVVTVNGWPSS